MSKARALPGVRVVVTGQDFPGYTGLYLKDRRIFALDRVRYVGEAVAAVAADTPEIAQQAVELIEVAYEPLPGVFDPEYGASPRRRSYTRTSPTTSRSRSSSRSPAPTSPTGSRCAKGTWTRGGPRPT